MSINIVVDDTVFKGLRDPYTDQPITVRVVAGRSGPPLFFSPDAFDPTVPETSPVDLFKKLSTRRGVIGVAREDAALICPYTGEVLTVRSTETGLAYVEGGFSPSTPVPNRMDFARAIWMRGGEIPEELRGATRPRVAARRIEPVETRPPPRTEASPEAASYVETHLAGLAAGITGAPRPTVVPVPGGAPKRRNKSKRGSRED